MNSMQCRSDSPSVVDSSSLFCCPIQSDLVSIRSQKSKS